MALKLPLKATLIWIHSKVVVRTNFEFEKSFVVGSYLNLDVNIGSCKNAQNRIIYAKKVFVRFTTHARRLEIDIAA